MRGPETRATPLGDCPGDGEWLGILLKLGTFLPHLPTRTLVDAEVNLPTVSRNSFWLFGSPWQLPDYDHADTFVDWLVREGELARDPVVDAALQGHLQDREREHHPASFLAGDRADAECGSSNRTRPLCHAPLTSLASRSWTPFLRRAMRDQPHLTRSLKYLIGQTPAQIREQSRPEQMPFLYKTTPFG